MSQGSSVLLPPLRFGEGGREGGVASEGRGLLDALSASEQDTLRKWFH